MHLYIKSIEFYKGVTIVRPTGNITFDNLAAAQEEWRSKMKDRPVKNILFDLKDVLDADTSGLAALIELLKYMHTHKMGDRIGLVNLSQKMRDLLEVSRAKELFNVYPSEEKAIKDLE